MTTNAADVARLVRVRRAVRAWDAALAELDLRLVRDRAAELHELTEGDLELRTAAGDLVIACAALKASRLDRRLVTRMQSARVWLEFVIDQAEHDAFGGLDESWTCACRAVNNGGATCVRCGQHRRTTS